MTSTILAICGAVLLTAITTAFLIFSFMGRGAGSGPAVSQKHYGQGTTATGDVWGTASTLMWIGFWIFVIYLLFQFGGCLKRGWERVTYSPPPPPPPLTEREAQEVRSNFLDLFYADNAAKNGWEMTPDDFSGVYIAPLDEGPTVPIGMNLDGLEGCLLRYKNRKTADQGDQCILRIGPVGSMWGSMKTLYASEGQIFIPPTWTDIQIQGRQSERHGLCSTPGDEWPIDLWIDNGNVRAGGSKLPIRRISTYKEVRGDEPVLWGILPDPEKYEYDVTVIFRMADGSRIDPTQKAPARGGFWIKCEDGRSVNKAMASDYGSESSHRLPKGQQGVLGILPPNLKVGTEGLPLRVYVTLIAK